MKTFVFEFIPYGRDLTGHLTYPVGRAHFDPEVAARSYHNVVEQVQLMEELGFDGICLNEHHGSPYGLDNSPHVFLGYLARATSRLKLALIGDLLPLHAHPLRVAEELAMLDVITRGRLITGFTRGIPREHLVYGVPLSESKARFDEALEVILNAWTTDLLTHHGRFFHYDSVDMWPRPYQKPHPPVWMAALTAEGARWIARCGFSLCFAFLPRPQAKELLQAFRETSAEAGRTEVDDDIVYGRHVFLAETQAEAERLCRPHIEYYFRDLTEGLTVSAFGKMRAMNPDFDFSVLKRPFDFSTVTLEGLREMGLLLVGTPDRVFADLMDQYEQMGRFGNLLAIVRMGAMPQATALRSVRLMGEELIPKLHAVAGAAAPVL